MKKTSLLKKYILEEEILIMPGAHDALTARIVEQAGFKAVTMGGYAASATLLGRPDVSLLTLTEMSECFRRVAEAVEIPLFVDGDTGHGGTLNVQRTVREMEGGGAAGMFIEDQVFPKRCGHMEGKQVIERAEMVAKIKAAVDARKDPDFIIMARTDALAVHGLEEAIVRGNLYREAGADMIFVEAPRSVEDMRAIISGVDAPTMANNLEGGKSPLLTAQELQAIGYNVVVFPVAATYAVAKAVQGLMAEIRSTGTSAGFREHMLDFTQFAEIMGLAELRDLEKSFY